MGIIREGHNTPGVYTKVTDIKYKNSVGSNKGIASSEKPTSTGGGGGSVSDKTIYYGYYPVISSGGTKTCETYQQLSAITADIITKSDNFNIKTVFDNSYTLNNGNDIIIPVQIKTDSYDEYFNICDKHNACAVIVVSKKLYDNNKITIKEHSITDGGADMTHLFDLIKPITINDDEYVILALFDNHFAYAPVNINKIISSMTVIFN